MRPEKQLKEIQTDSFYHNKGNLIQPIIKSTIQIWVSEHGGLEYWIFCSRSSDLHLYDEQ